MSKLNLPYIRDAIKFADRMVQPPKEKRKYTYAEAAHYESFVYWGLRFYKDEESTPPPLEFTQYLLRAKAIGKRGCADFLLNLSPVSECLKELIDKLVPEVEIKQVHQASSGGASPFQDVFVRYFVKKLIYNLRDEPGRYEYCENFATVFPFPVLDFMPAEYYIEIGFFLDDDFYTEIQSFLDEHFKSVKAREVVSLLLANIENFKKNTNNHQQYVYRRSFYRLNERGIVWYKKLHTLYQHVRKIFDKVYVNMNAYNEQYFHDLPDRNTDDLGKLANLLLYLSNREEYIELFQKYLFFFLHALNNLPNPVSFIDNALFECLKSLHKFKTSAQDVDLASDIAKLSWVHLRSQPKVHNSISHSTIAVNTELLQRIKEYVLKIPNIDTARMDVEYKTDYLHDRMLLRTEDTCYEICYSVESQTIEDFHDRVLCSVLPSESEQIKNIVIYNAYLGTESRLAMPEAEDTETIRNYVRFANTYDFENDPDAEPKNAFLQTHTEYFTNFFGISDHHW